MPHAPCSFANRSTSSKLPIPPVYAKPSRPISGVPRRVPALHRGAGRAYAQRGMDATELAILDAIARKVLWLSTYMVHHANSIRPNADGTKVGGHQASASSLVSILTALYFRALRTDDVVAVKAHASPAFYAIQYLRGRLDAERLKQLRVFGGLQAYPSRRKNPEIVD